MFKLFFSEVWRDLKKNPLITFFVIIQIMLTSYVITFTINEYFYTDYAKQMTESTFSDKSFHYINMKPGSWLINDNEKIFTAFLNAGKDIPALKEYSNPNWFEYSLKAMNKIEELGIEPVLAFIDQGILEKPLENAPLKDGNNEFFSYASTKGGYRTNVNTVRISYNFFDTYNLQFIKGEKFKKSDFTSLNFDEVPIIMGYDYMEYFELGDVIRINPFTQIEFEINDIEKYNNAYTDTLQDEIGKKEGLRPYVTLLYAKIVGFLDKDQRFQAKTEHFKTDRQIFVPNFHLSLESTGDLYNENFVKRFYLSEFRESIYIVKNNETGLKKIEEAQKIFKEFDLPEFLMFTADSYASESFVAQRNEFWVLFTTLSSAMLLFSSFGLIFSFIVKATKNIKTYAIHNVIGGSLGGIIFRYAVEIFIILIVGFWLGLNVFVIQFKEALLYENMQKTFMYAPFFLICLCIVLTILISLFIYIKMRSFSVSQLIRGNEAKASARVSAETFVMALSFALISVYTMFMASYAIKEKTLSMEYNDFYSSDAKDINIFMSGTVTSDTPPISFDFTNLGDNYSLSKLITETYDKNSNPKMRAVYDKGDVFVPTIIDGRYFEAADFEKNKTNGKYKYYAVLGKQAYEDFAFEQFGKSFFTYDGVNYEVIGVMGLEDSISDLDRWAFITLPSSISKSGYTGLFSIDTKNKTDIDNAANTLKELAASETANIQINDKPVGINYNRPTWLLMLLFYVLVINVVVFSIYYVDKKQKSTAIKKLIGANFKMLFSDVFRTFLAIAFAGFASSAFILTLMTNTILKGTAESELYSVSPDMMLLAFAGVAAVTAAITAFSVFSVYKKDTSNLLR